MAGQPPGVFIEEIARGPRPIQGVPTSVTAFIGRAWRGPVDQPVVIRSFRDYERQFGGLWQESTLGFALRQFFENGGTQAIVVRVATRSGAAAAKPALLRLTDGEVFRAASPGSWGLNLKIAVDLAGVPRSADQHFILTVRDDVASKRDSAKRGGSGVSERFVDLSVDPASPRFVGTVLEQQSQLLRLDRGLRAVSPRGQTAIATDGSGSDGAPIGTAEVNAPENRTARTGLYALDKVDLFNLLCLPPLVPDKDNGVGEDWAPAAEYCRERRAFLIVDAPQSWTPDNAAENVAAFDAIARENAAIYFPHVQAANPLDGRSMAFAPCGMIAGVMSRTDGAQGVWKAPAGTGANLRGVTGLWIKGQVGHLTDEASRPLNTAGINCLREFRNVGVVVWGARTLAGADAMSSDWKYVPVRRYFLYLERSIDRGIQWVVFEPNDERTWGQVRATVSNFLTNEFRRGALVGSAPSQAFFVTCDRTTMTQDDILNGRLIVEIGIAPVRPAEFVIFRIFQNTAESMR